MLIVGAKGFAKEVLEVLCQLKQKDDIVFFDNVNNFTIDKLYSRYEILKSFEDVKYYFENIDKRFTLGLGNPLLRKKLYNKFKELGGEFTSIISPFAHIGHFGNRIDEGCNIMTGTVITNDVVIKKGALINLNCTIGHDSILGEFTELSPGVHVSGNCKIGNYSSLGTNATVLPKIRIGTNVIIGAGAVVTKDIPDNSLAVGIPAKIIKNVKS